MNGRVSVVIPNWNGEKLLPDCLRHLLATRFDKLGVIVVDNGSTDGSRELVRRDFPLVRLIALPSNLGFAKACNEGIKSALSEDDPAHIVLLNNDAEPREPDWLEKLVKAVDRDPRVGVAGCRLVYPDGSDQELGRRLSVLKHEGLLSLAGWSAPAEPFEVDTVIGAVFLMTRRVIETIGLLDEGFFLGMEDTDYCVRARAAGFVVELVPEAQVVHHRSATISRQTYLAGYPLDRETEVRFRLLNNPLWSAPLFAASEARLLAAHLFPRKDGGGRALSSDWKAYAGGFFDGYRKNLKNLADIIHKRYHRAEKQWY